MGQWPNLIPDRSLGWSPELNPWVRVTFSLTGPQKGHNIADLPGVDDFVKILFRSAREFSKQKVAPECEDENIQ